MNKRVKHIAILGFAIFCFFYFLPSVVLEKTKKEKKRVCILSPYSHSFALQVQKSLKENLEEKGILATVINTDGNLGLFQEKLKKLRTKKIDLFITLGTKGSEIFLENGKLGPLFYVGANVQEELIEKYKGEVVGGLDDQVPPEHQAEFIKSLLPSVNKIALLYDGDFFPKEDLEAFRASAVKNDLLLQEIKIYRFSELFTISRAVQNDTQAVFIFKDDLILEGIDKVVKATTKLRIPLLASDLESVKNGAAAAWAVSETNLGEEAAKLIELYLANKELSESYKKNWWQENSLIWINKEAMKLKVFKIEDVYLSSNKTGKAIQQVP
ncbi:hypothetical protein AB751O23_AA_00390 [Chlamydiales bacterium SCGC AB-751-O23]|jgi:putative tryptophan/tyrosine transport system substrate-binding protein|nr:hypothetical protein AB751O23_AA_00390 [Chlamydiales bacterium SCGC AB-751-O23]